jgi:hypothetical protein
MPAHPVIPAGIQRTHLSKGAMLTALIAVLCLLTIPAISALNLFALFKGNGKTTAAPAATVQSQNPQPAADWHNSLALQPEGDRQRRRLGKRFLTSGKETATLTGHLTTGTEKYTVRITRSQDAEGESINIGINGGPPSLIWNGKDGAVADGRAAAGTERTLIERIALDSPDQFIQAQQRGAAYFTVARSVRPESAGGDDKYSGPVWDLVRVAEPVSSENKPQSHWRLYYLNPASGLIDRVVSQEAGETTIAEFSDWVTQDGETFPTRIIWKQKEQVVMELVLLNATHGPKQ